MGPYRLKSGFNRRLLEIFPGRRWFRWRREILRRARLASARGNIRLLGVFYEGPREQVQDRLEQVCQAHLKYAVRTVYVATLLPKAVDGAWMVELCDFLARWGRHVRKPVQEFCDHMTGHEALTPLYTESRDEWQAWEAFAGDVWSAVKADPDVETPEEIPVAFTTEEETDEDTERRLL